MADLERRLTEKDDPSKPIEAKSRSAETKTVTK